MIDVTAEWRKALDDLVAACDPLELSIEGDFHVRGNIKTVVRAAYVKPVAKSRKK